VSVSDERVRELVARALRTIETYNRGEIIQEQDAAVSFVGGVMAATRASANDYLQRTTFMSSSEQMLDTYESRQLVYLTARAWITAPEQWFGVPCMWNPALAVLGEMLREDPSWSLMILLPEAVMQTGSRIGGPFVPEEERGYLVPVAHRWADYLRQTNPRPITPEERGAT
jgi:hypothetical protein